jgi:4-carboxymuconolactone decarboxylase
MPVGSLAVPAGPDRSPDRQAGRQEDVAVRQAHSLSFTATQYGAAQHVQMPFPKRSHRRRRSDSRVTTRSIAMEVTPTAETAHVHSESARVYENVPQFRRLREDVLLGDVWKQPELARRDRIFVTCGILAAGGKLDELKYWMRRGVEAGITLDELRAFVVHVALYAGWPAGLCAGKAALELFEEGPTPG